MKKCTFCAEEIQDDANVCRFCRHDLVTGKLISQIAIDDQQSKKSRIGALILCIFLGWLGVHRFYVGKIGTGILQLLTLGCFGFWTLVDFFVIACGSFTDSDGKKLTKW